MRDDKELLIYTKPFADGGIIFSARENLKNAVGKLKKQMNTYTITKVQNGYILETTVRNPEWGEVKHVFTSAKSLARHIEKHFDRKPDAKKKTNKKA